MIEVPRTQIEEFAKSEFPGKKLNIGNGYWYIQAGTCLGGNLHYEYQRDKVHLHIEGRHWKNIRNYLKNNVKDSRVTSEWWDRNDCCWTLNTVPASWEEIKDAFRTIAYIMDPHILKFESTQNHQIEKEVEDQPVTADFIKISVCLKKALVIPEYQRPYRWNSKNVEQLLRDISNNKSNGKLTYLIGTVILHKEKDNEYYNIVDGQQRITTIILLLKQLGYDDVMPELKYNHCDSFYNISNNYKYIGEWLNSNIADRQSFMKYILDSCMFVEIIVKNLNEAFQMFESQNGRGKELEAYNLLKAYHIRAMSSAPREEKILCDKRWEDATMQVNRSNKRKDILSQLFNEQLYRTRVWTRGKDAYGFNKANVDEFKGITIDNESTIDFAYQNILLQQEIANMMLRTMNTNLFKIKSRFIHGDSDNINPFVSITQMILNGKAFFDYVETYVEIYKRLFMQLESSQLFEFKKFYKTSCLYQSHCYRKGDGYIREVYKSAIMMTFDRFGEKGVNDMFNSLYICIYKYRLEKKQVRYETMATNKNVGWIFQTIKNAKNLADLNVIKQQALNLKKQINIIYSVQEIVDVFKNS